MLDVDNKKILLVGYGNMGKMIKVESHHFGMQIHDIIDLNIPEHKKDISFSKIKECDVAIEFSHPDFAFENICTLLEYRIPVVSGTTGWFNKLEMLKNEYDFSENTLIYSANFSVGMNLFYQLVADASKLISSSRLYDIYGLESHHRKKIDSPSGTARVISDIVLENFEGKDKVRFDLNNQPLTEKEFNFSSVRCGNITGYHKIGFDSEFDEIDISHNAKNRRGFAIGALMAARYALNHKGMLNFKDIFSEVLANEN